MGTFTNRRKTGAKLDGAGGRGPSKRALDGGKEQGWQSLLQDEVDAMPTLLDSPASPPLKHGPGASVAQHKDG